MQATKRARELDKIEQEKTLSLRQVGHTAYSDAFAFLKAGAVLSRMQSTLTARMQGTRDERILCLRMWPGKCQGKAPTIHVDGREMPAR